jgi:hypothetical protein
VAEQHLDHANVSLLLEQVGGEAVSRRMQGDGPLCLAHRDDEWCRIDTLVSRAQALVLTILEVAAGMIPIRRSRESGNPGVACWREVALTPLSRGRR